MLLAQLYAVVSDPLFSALAVQCLLGSLSSVLVYLIAIHFYSQKVGITAGLAAALYGTLIYFDAELLPVTLTIFLILAALYLLLRYRENRGILPLIVAAIAFALAGSATPETLILVPVAAWWIFREPDRGKKARLIHSIIFVLAAIVMTTPFVFINHSRGGEKIPYLTDISLRLATANQEQANGRTVTLPNSARDLGLSYSSAIETSFRASVRELPVTEIGSFWLRRTLSSIADNPLDWIKLELRKLVYLISSYEIATDRPLYYFAQGNFPLSFLLWEGALNFPLGIILPLALLAPLATRNSRRSQSILLQSVIALSLVTLLFNIFAYQRLLVVPFVIVWAAAGAWGLIELYRKHEYRRFYRWLVLLLVATVVVNGVTKIPGLSPAIDSNFEGRMFLANSLLAADRLGHPVLTTVWRAFTLVRAWIHWQSFFMTAPLASTPPMTGRCAESPTYSRNSRNSVS
jgi:4-amino-4-deoxy-L-arabinose transferase-like glycosyltransferase